ncbi:hypothetical protein EYZ11_012578 [Aspergillus tanneri]|uniref:Globin-sensor domain-containing protein n=1 Tax=Aspergillus tanneri TaxID=1220188 RepID=A0A4S3J212_9EURO|nr:hypothetical protein EYZ11_012578 [Aspergillus tanneri]
MGDDIRHATRQELYTDLTKRIKYLHAFLNFTVDDIEILNRGSKYLKAAIPTLAHRLYEKMLQFDLTARALRTRSTSSETQIEDLFTIDSPHVQRRKIFWKWYLTRLCSDPSEPGYWEYLDKVGKMHTGKVLLHPLNIEYMHMNVCLGYVQDLFFETISCHPEMTIQFRLSLIRSMNKMLCIQNDLISRYYIRDGQEFTDAGVVPGPPKVLKKTEETAEGREEVKERDQESITASIAESIQSDQHSISDSFSVPGSRGNTELRRVRSPSETTSTLSTTSSIESVQRTTIITAAPVSPGVVSPFSNRIPAQAFETKIWSGGKKPDYRLKRAGY